MYLGFKVFALHACNKEENLSANNASVKMQKDDDKYNDNNYHHDGEVDGLHIEVDLHDQIPTGASLASAFQRLQSGAISLPPPMKRLFPFFFLLHYSTIQHCS